MNNKIYAYFYSNEDNICIIVRGHWKISRKGNKIRKKESIPNKILVTIFMHHAVKDCLMIARNNLFLDLASLVRSLVDFLEAIAHSYSTK